MSSSQKTAGGMSATQAIVGGTSTRVLMSRLIRDSVCNHVRPLVCAVFFMGVMAGATALSAWLMKPVVNELFIDRNEAVLLLVSGVIALTFVVKGGANYAQETLMSHVGLKIVAEFQNRLFSHLSRMDVAFFQRHQTGDLVSRFTIDINAMRNAVSNVLTSLGKDILSLAGLVVVMFVQDLQLAMIALVVFPVAVYPIARLGRRLRKAAVGAQAEMGQMTTLVGQTFQGIRTVKSYQMETYEQGRLAVIVDAIRRLSLKVASTRALASPVMETLGGIAVALVMIYGGHQVTVGATDPGSFFSFITALLMAYEPMKRLANLNASLQAGLAGAERMYELLDSKPSITDAVNAGPLVVSGGTVRLENVIFSYEADAGTRTLNGVDLEAPAGKTVALVGPSGAGKTTILNMIPRFHDPDAGRILIDGVDVRSATRESIMRAIALVSQDITLFDDTIRANIAFGCPDATEGEIRVAAKAAGAHGFIIATEAGYDTPVGEQGLKLSGGQRQRIAIARAFLKNAPILLLDEATSALDAESERHVQKALHQLMRGRTSMVIAHRLSTIKHADIIYVLDGGRVIERGNHDKLMSLDGHYARYHAMQFGDTVRTGEHDAAVVRVAGG